MKMSIKVYAKVNSDNYITDINSEIFLNDKTGYVQIDSGDGDKFAHAQGNYFDKPLIDSDGFYNYKLDKGKAVERTSTEKYSDSTYLNLIKATKTTEIKNTCGEKIISGFNSDAKTTGTFLHYTLEQTKQDDMKVLMASILNGATEVLWHDSSRVMHEVYNATQFTALYKAAMNYIVSCKVFSDGLEQYLANVLAGTDENKVTIAKAINWDTILPTDIQTIVDQQIALMKQK
jgi:hypothetical protein